MTDDMCLCFCAGNMGMAEKVYKEVLRQDPDSVASMKSIKRIRLMHTAKDAGNEAFKVGSLDSQTRSFAVRGCSGNTTRAHHRCTDCQGGLIRGQPWLRKPQAQAAHAHCHGNTTLTERSTVSLG